MLALHFSWCPVERIAGDGGSAPGREATPHPAGGEAPLSQRYGMGHSAVHKLLEVGRGAETSGAVTLKHQRPGLLERR
jgi:hypothetical protein